MYIYIYIYIYTYNITVGAKYSTPEINTSEIIMDVQLHFPMDFQWHFPTESHLSVALSKGLSLGSHPPERRACTR